jgi:hypothetical protein
MLGSSSVAEQLAASQEGLNSMKLVDFIKRGKHRRQRLQIKLKESKVVPAKGKKVKLSLCLTN